MTEPEFEYRVAKREDGRAWAVEYRSDPLETWSSLPRRFRTREAAKDYVISQTNQARVEEKQEVKAPRDWFNIAFALFFAMLSAWWAADAGGAWVVGFGLVTVLWVYNAWITWRG